ncbi:helix-turn-helix domain-containing protein [Gilvimarinus sp. F26214L]|uniref:helix-turn-helix domain-containing protein n=1 Tax=Gilvimarinus sp. DZF01 TaxID=3461371 RepID=UPI0040457AC2
MNSDVGARMLVLRKLNGWSQRQLAKRAGVPHSAISMIEHGQVSPSINSLQKVLDGVPISLADFFALDLDVQIRVFFKKNEITRSDDNGITRSMLRSKGGEHAVSMIRECYPPGANSGDELLVDEGELIGYVSCGCIELTVGGETDVLHCGDGFYFERRRPHRFRNLSAEPAELVATVVPSRPRYKP